MAAYSLSAIIQLLNPDNTISAHRMLAHAIGMTENDFVRISGKAVMYYEIIDRLKEIISRSYLSDCFTGFEDHWKTLIAEKDIILNTNKTIDKKSAQNPYIRVFA